MLPERLLEPPQPFDAMHDVALVVFHVSVDVAPLVMGVGFAKRDTIGRGRGLTVIVVVACLVPPSPLQSST